MDTEQYRLSDISPVCLVRMVVRNLWTVVVAALIFAMGSSLYLDWFHQPVYESSMTYVVTSRRSSYTSSNNLSATKSVASVMAELLNGNLMLGELKEASEELASFSGTIEARQVENTNLITITARAGTPEEAFRAMKELEEVFPTVSDLVSSSAVAQVVRKPTVTSFAVNQMNRLSLAVKAGALGALLMAALLCWINITRETIQTREGARHRLDAPVIATVFHEQKSRTLRQVLKRKKRGLQVFSPTISYAYAEQINVICSRLEQESASRNRKIFMVTGVGENEGKSTIAGNVAAMLAMKGKRVALVDADLRKPAMNKFFDGAYRSDLPLNRFLAQPYSRENFTRCMVKHGRLGLFMFFCENAAGNQLRLLTGDTMRQMLQQLRAFDYVIIDTPPMGLFADTHALADLVDATLMVVRQDYTSAWDLNEAADVLKAADSEFLGCVLNGMSGESLAGYGYGYGETKTKYSARKGAVN